jgi:hypothetical protein
MELLPSFATTISLLAVSTVIVATEDKPVAAPAIVLIGATLPFAVLLYTVMELLEKFVTNISLFVTSTATPTGTAKPVAVLLPPPPPSPPPPPPPPPQAARPSRNVMTRERDIRVM